MRVVDTRQIYKRQRQRAQKKKRLRFSVVLVSLVMLLSGYSYITYQLPLPEAKAVAAPVQAVVSDQPALQWPAYGQAAIGSPTLGLLGATQDQKPVPTASVAKVMTALAVLKQKPLGHGQLGPVLTMDAVDIASYNYYAANNGSYVPVTEGEQITQYQALQAILLPSANNMAESLARWAYGSLDAYATAANTLAKQLGMSQTHIADASGFSPDTVSTAHDLVLLGLAALEEPVLAEIMAQSVATIPVAGTIRSTNRLLGQHEIFGIKTGNTDQAGGCYLFAANHSFSGGQKQVLVGAIMAAPSLDAAMQDALPLLTSAYDGFGELTVAHKGDVLGSYTFPWGAKNQAVASEDVKVFGWRQATILPVVQLDSLPANATSGSMLGTITASSKLDKQSRPVVSDSPTQAPSWRWRLLRR